MCFWCHVSSQIWFPVVADLQTKLERQISPGNDRPVLKRVQRPWIKCVGWIGAILISGLECVWPSVPQYAHVHIGDRAALRFTGSSCASF